MGKAKQTEQKERGTDKIGQVHTMDATEVMTDV